MSVDEVLGLRGWRMGWLAGWLMRASAGTVCVELEKRS
jgi:hypothetical protein